MSILQYPKSQHHIVVGNLGSAITPLGSVEVDADGILKYVQLRSYNVATPPFSYQLRLIGSHSVAGAALWTSDWETFSDTAIGQLTGYWLGDLVFTVDRYPMKAGLPLFIRMETSGYTRNADITYMTIWCNDSEPVGGSTESAGARFILGVER